MNIGIIGTGGVGGYIGGRLSVLLEHRQDINLHFIARGAHLEEIKKNGLLLESADEKIICQPAIVTDDFSQLPELDICIMTVKSYELEKVCQGLKGRISDSSLILPLLNGADIAERIRKNLDKGVILPACIYIISFIKSPGIVHLNVDSGLIHLGSEDGRTTAKDCGATELLRLFDDAGIRYRWHDDPKPEIWKKFLFIASFALVTARFDAVTGAVMESDEMSGSVKKIMAEIRDIASARGIILADEVCTKAYKLGNQFDYNSTTSFQRDYRIKGKPDERDIFGGAIIRMGRDVGINTDETERIYSDLIRMKPMP